MVRIGVIGAGRWGPNYVRNFGEIEGVEVVAVADPREEALTAIGHRFPDLQLLQDYRDLANHEGIDGVVIATPARSHYEIGTACLQAGKHVLIEKPLAASAADALELARYPLAPGQIFMVGHIFRFHAREEQSQERDVAHRPLQIMPHRRRNLHGHAVEQVQSDRNVVRREVPDDGDIPADRAQVGADALDITDSA